MPDLFVPPDEKDTTIMHKRMPADSGPTQTTPTFIPPTKPQQPTPPATSEVKKTVILGSIRQPAETTPESLNTAPPIQTSPIPPSPTPSGLPTETTIPLFSAFWQNPKGVYFDTQEINEHILLFLRRHPITNLGWITTTILLALLPPAAFIFSAVIGHPLIILSPSFTFALVVFYYLLISTQAFLNFLNWYFNISLITEKRVIDIELNGLVGKKISATKISLVQDVNYQQQGTLRSVFDYGDVLIQTASALDNFYVHAVPKPEVVVRVVEEIIGEGDNHV